MNKSLINTLFILLLLAYLPISFAQDYNNPCFYCHMNVLVTMKFDAAIHWEAEIQCVACHGASNEHIDEEDNSIKPDSVWNSLNVHQLCDNCHQEESTLYLKGSHSGYLRDQASAGNDEFPDCTVCHGAHIVRKKNEIETTCLSCHTEPPETCNTQNLINETQNNFITCVACHSPHQLNLVSKEVDIKN